MKPLMISLLLAVLATVPARAGEIAVAVASNFLSTAEVLVSAFEAEHDVDVQLAHGSTGQIFAQVSNGAPFDVFLSADTMRPNRLREAGRAVSVRPYAIGRLVLVSREPVTEETIAEQFEGRVVALADPTVAPYGLAATSAMESLSLDTATFQPVLVANVGQVATIFATGNADFVFLAASLLPRLSGIEVFDLDGKHPPIVQSAALLTEPETDKDVAAFWQFLFSEEARGVITDAGYNLPE